MQKFEIDPAKEIDKEKVEKLYELLNTYGALMDQGNTFFMALKSTCKIEYDPNKRRSTVYITDDALDMITDWLFNYKMLAEFSDIRINNRTVH